MTTPPEPTPGGPPGPAGRKRGGLLGWARKHPGPAAAGVAGGGLVVLLLLRKNAANAPGDLQDPAAGTGTGTPTAAGTVPASFADTGNDPFGAIENQIQALQNQLSAATAGQHPPPANPSIYALARTILQKRGNLHPTKKQIMAERGKLLKIGQPPRKPPKVRKPTPPRMHPGARR